LKPLNSNQIKDTLQIRIVENLHIFLWLIKDLCWSMEWKTGGIMMVVPTVAMAFYIAWKSRKNLSELLHSIAVCCWICANSVWMIGEFTGHENRFYAAGLFAIGILIVVYYYAFHFRKDQEESRRIVAAVSDLPTSGQ
jgi:hypothetical protein